MKIFVTAKPKAHEAKITKVSDNMLTVAVREPPIDGRANHAILVALAEYFKVSFSRVRLVSGHTSRQKVIEIM